MAKLLSAPLSQERWRDESGSDGQLVDMTLHGVSGEPSLNLMVIGDKRRFRISFNKEEIQQLDSIIQRLRSRL